MQDRMSLIEEQVEGLIDLVLDGEDANDLMEGVYSEINEGPGNGPYHIGSKVKVNTGWSGQGIDGSNVNVSKGDVVSVVLANLGEEGQDRMVLLADGKTRVVVPFAILGEGLEEQSMMHGPKGHVVKSAKGKLGGMVQGRAQGDATTPEQSMLKPIPGTRKPSSLQSKSIGKAKPKGDPTAQMQGQMVPSTISGKTVEQVVDEVLSRFEEISEKDASAQSLSEMLVSEDDEIMYAIMHEALFGEGECTLDTLQGLAEMMKDKKKKNKKDDDEEGYTEEDIDEIFSAMHEASMS